VRGSRGQVNNARVSTPRFDLNLLLVFEAVLASRSTTRAAAHLGLTQSAVSNALNRLRTALGDPLFVRTPEGMMPTPRALEISLPLKEAIERIRTTLAQQQDFDAAHSDRVFRIYMSDVGQMVMLPKVMETVQRDAPGVCIETVHVGSLREREACMSSGEVDLAVGYFQDFSGPFHCQALFREEYVCMVRQDHPLARRGMSLREFAALRHAVYHPCGGGHAIQEQAIAAAMASHGLGWRVSLRSTHFLAFTRMIAESDMVTTLPRMLALAGAHSVPVKIMAPPVAIPTFEVAQFWHKRFHLDPGNRWLRGLFARHHARGGAEDLMPAEVDLMPEDAA
jgi:DNA-binding transcriptional LysR family regulator